MQNMLGFANNMRIYIMSSKKTHSVVYTLNDLQGFVTVEHLFGTMMDIFVEIS